MDSFGFKVRYYLCQTCGFVFQNPGESAAADPAFYEETYRKLYQSTEEPTAKDLRQQRLRAEYQLNLMQNHGVCRLSRALDIGASSGTLMQTIHEAYGGEMIGVEPGKAARIFDEFYRCDDSLASSRSGTGLGLSIARDIARRHGGDVTYEPRDGGGSVFALRLPLCASVTERRGTSA